MEQIIKQNALSMPSLGAPSCCLYLLCCLLPCTLSLTPLGLLNVHSHGVAFQYTLLGMQAQRLYTWHEWGIVQELGQLIILQGDYEVQP